MVTPRIPLGFEILEAPLTDKSGTRVGTAQVPVVLCDDGTFWALEIKPPKIPGNPPVRTWSQWGDAIPGTRGAIIAQDQAGTRPRLVDQSSRNQSTEE